MPDEPEELPPPRQLVEGVDYTIENGLLVFTAGYLRSRGYCCGSTCRNCPFIVPANKAGAEKVRGAEAENPNEDAG